MNWKKRGAYVLGSYITGYGGGMGTSFGLTSYNQNSLDFVSVFVLPAIAGLIVAIPQLGKIITEYGTMGDQ